MERGCILSGLESVLVSAEQAEHPCFLAQHVRQKPLRHIDAVEDARRLRERIGIRVRRRTGAPLQLREALESRYKVIQGRAVVALVHAPDAFLPLVGRQPCSGLGRVIELCRWRGHPRACGLRRVLELRAGNVHLRDACCLE